MIVETVKLSDLPELPDFAPDRLAAARAAFDRGDTPPPLLLLRDRRGLHVYDGISRITAASERGIAELPAVIVATPTEAVRLRVQLGKYPSVAEAWEALL